MLIKTENCINILKSSCEYLRSNAEYCAASSITRGIKNESYMVLGENWIRQQFVNSVPLTKKFE